MKRFLLSLLSLIIAISVIGISIKQTAKPFAIAIEDQISVPNKEATKASNLSITASQVDYYLPYPGILPDHSFYWLKMIRDRVKLLLTIDKIEKIKLLILYADKRIGAASALAKGNQIGHSVTTATKAEKYLLQAENNLINLNSSGANKQQITKLWETLNLSSITHLQILANIKQIAPDKTKSIIDESKENTQKILSKTQEVLNIKDDNNSKLENHDSSPLDEPNKDDKDTKEDIQKNNQNETQGEGEEKGEVEEKERKDEKDGQL